jgi:hypothetical protein
MGLVRKKPFVLISGILALGLLVLSIVTKRLACWSQAGADMYFSEEDAACESQCNSAVALKLATTVQATPTDPIVTIFLRCPWDHDTSDIFLAAASAIFIWILLEVFLALKRRYHVAWNFILLCVIGIGVVAACYIIHDLQVTNCDEVVLPGPTTSCNRSLFIVSFIFIVIILFLLFFQLILNIVRRRTINEQDIKYSNVPQNPTENVAGTEANVGERIS